VSEKFMLIAAQQDSHDAPSISAMCAGRRSPPTSGAPSTPAAGEALLELEV